MFAVFIPYLTEELYQRFYAEGEGVKSLHISRWPKVDREALNVVEKGEMLEKLVETVNFCRSKLRLPHSSQTKNPYH